MMGKTPKRLIDFCVKTDPSLEEDFVGIRSESNEPRIYFPRGYNLPTNQSDTEVRFEVRSLINVLSRFLSQADMVLNVGENKNDEPFPIQAYLDLINYYFENNGRYYTDNETLYKQDLRGKVNWSKTIKKVTPNVYQTSDNDLNLVYLERIVRIKQPKTEQLITEIHKYTTHEAFLKMGWLYGNLVPQNTQIDTKDKTEFFKLIIREKLTTTYQDRLKVLFLSMIKVLDYIGKEHNKDNYYYGTKKFNIVWEKMIDEFFGIKSKDKEKYNVNATWNLGGAKKTKHPLIPDTIMLYGDKLYVLDAKYYRYGVTGNSSHLPQASDINKQITYGEYAKQKSDKVTYNAFLMPYDKSANKLNQSEDIIKIGEATGDWKPNPCEYEKIQGILVDTRFLMLNYEYRRLEDKKRLASEIEREF